MRRFIVCAITLTLSTPAMAETGFGGVTGLLTVPTADVQGEGAASLGASRHNPKPGQLVDIENYYLTLGFAPGLEVGGRIAEGDQPGAGLRDLSFNAKYRFWEFAGGPAFAVGGQDIGGEAQFFRSVYAVGTWPWRTLNVSAGYGWGPDILEGVLGGVEWRPWPFVGVLGEYDTEYVNAGLKLSSGPLIEGLRIGLRAGYRGATDETEYGLQLEFPLGRRDGARHGAEIVGRQSVADVAPAGPKPGGMGMPPYDARDRRGGTPPHDARHPVGRQSVADARTAAPKPGGMGMPPYENPRLRAALTDLGFESVRLGIRPPRVQVVTLEDRRYNHSSADGIGLALGVIATHADPAVESIELTVSAYGVPQLTVAVPAPLYRAFLQDPAGAAPELRQGLQARQADGVENEAEIHWDPTPTPPLGAVELVIEPVLRTFAATEFGVFDYGLGVRARLTAPLARGFLVHLGVQAPVALSDDFREGGNFESTGPEAGLDLALAQYLHKPAPQWTWLWSLGRAQVFQSDLDTLALEQLWLSEEGTHQLRAKLMVLHTQTVTREVALAGYTWFDPARDYSVALTGGRFFAGDAGFRLELNRHFGDTICGLFFKAATPDDQAGGIQISLPLTPRRDAFPRGIQVKGARRWGHALSSTLNAFDQRNPLRPLLLFEPTLDLDLRRDLFDSGRLGSEYLRDQLPRMHEAFETWGTP